MSIPEALERAKKLHKQRRDAAAPQLAADEAHASIDDLGSRTELREEIRADPDVEIPFPDLAGLAFDVSACDDHNILRADEQVGELARAAAAIRLMRGRVLHRVKSSGWSCIGITSPGPGEGKTITALNLAISIAREKQRAVYLLDLDMRNPSVFEKVGVQPPRALSGYFTEDLQPHDVLFATDVDNLVVAGNREPVSSPSELLATPRLEELLRYIRRRSRSALIIIDLPPVLSTDEALVVAPRVDAMFLVVAEGVTRREGVSKAMDLLSDFTVAGIIMNRSTADVGSDYYGY